MLDVADKVLEDLRVGMVGRLPANLPLPLALAKTGLKLLQIQATPEDEPLYRLLASDFQQLRTYILPMVGQQGAANEWIEALEVHSRALITLAAEPGLGADVRTTRLSEAVRSWHAVLANVNSWSEISMERGKACLGFALLCMQLLKSDAGSTADTRSNLQLKVEMDVTDFLAL